MAASAALISPKLPSSSVRAKADRSIPRENSALSSTARVPAPRSRTKSGKTHRLLIVQGFPASG